MTRYRLRVLSFAVLLMLAAGGAPARGETGEVTDPGARFADAMLEEIEALRVPCPLDLTDGLPADRLAHCAKLRQDEAQFRKDWKKAIRRSDLGRWRPVAVSAWQSDPGMITRYYDLGYIQVVAIFDTETRALMIVQERLGPCPTERPAIEEVVHEGCHFGPATDPDSVLDCPEPLDRVQPELPDIVRIEAGRRSSGKVVATLTIDDRGSIAGICIVSAEPPHAEWIRSAVNALREWSFPPATRDGEAVAVRRTLAMSYRLGPAAP